MAQINKPNQYFNTKLYTGTGSAQSITGVDFQPDMVWIKDRTGTGYHRINDAVRGATKEIYPNVANAENTEPQAVTSFDTDGFTVGSNNGYSQNGYNFASWNWLGANGTASNTDGSITSTVSANTTSGFSIVSYTGTGSNATIGHGLGSAPQVVLIKERNGTNNWLMSHQPLSASLGDYTRFMTLNSTSAVSGAGNVVFQNSAFTSSVFNVGTSVGSNGSGQNFIAYCFADVKGYSKFNFYTGNGSADGTFVYTGFKPSFILVKSSSAGSTGWNILDNKRDPENVMDTILQPNNSNADANDSNKYCDFLSNGFKWRASGGETNGSGTTFIYMAFAENPLVGTNNIPATAR